MKIFQLHTGDDELHIRAVRLLNDFEMPLERSRELLAEPTYVFLVAIDSFGDIMGRIYGHVLHRYGQTDLLLYEVDVAEQHQRKGVGKAMMENIRTFCTEHHYNEMWVLTEEDNIPARALYRNTGGRLEASPTMMYVFDTI